MKLFLIFVALSCLSIATAGIIFEDPAKHSNSNAENKADNKNDNSKDGEEVVLSLDEKNDTVTESEGKILYRSVCAILQLYICIQLSVRL